MPDAVNFSLYLADNCLVLAQRNSEWCAHGPILEQDIAITNITLDQIGQSRNFYQYAASLMNQQEPGATHTEDSLAYLRKEHEFKNLLLTELPNGDWGQTILRQYFFSVYQSLLFTRLENGSDVQLAAIAAKSLKEIAYHIKWSREWVIRLGDGTTESHEKMKNALDRLWMYCGEMFEPAAYEIGFVDDHENMHRQWMTQVTETLEEATLPVPGAAFVQSGGKFGRHTEHFGFLLAEMQYLQRAYPGAEW